MIVSGGITKNCLSKRKVDPCGICSLRAKANSDLYIQCGKWIHSRCAGEKKMITKMQKNLASRKYERNIGKATEQEEKSCNENKELTYLGDSSSADGGCETAVTARKRCEWDRFMECGELLHERRFPGKLKEVVYK